MKFISLFAKWEDRIKLSVKTHGALKSIIRAFRLFGIHLAYQTKKYIFRSKFDQDLLELENKISEHESFFDLLLSPMGWNSFLFQRYQHISMEAAKSGGLALYGGNLTLDHKLFVYEEVFKNLFVFNCSDGEVVDRVYKNLKRRHQPCLLHVLSIDMFTTPEMVNDYVRDGFHVIYDYIDEISSEINGIVPEMVNHRHEMAIKNEQILVAATSDQLYENVRKYRTKNLILSTNGVDPEPWKVEKGPPPADLQACLTKNKILGYHGALASWVDYEILNLIANSGIYELVLIGFEIDHSFDDSGLKDHSRVHFLGSKSHFDLYSYAAYYDVAILPFKKTKLTDAVSPVKIFEYMAARKPIVTTDIRECKKYKSCLVAKDQEEFLQKLDLALILKDDPTYLQILDSEVKANSWHQKFYEITTLAGIKLEN